MGDKISHLISLIEGKLPDIMLLCETWLTPFSPDLNIPGYIFCHLDRINKKGSGVGILLHNNLRYNVISDEKFNHNEFEGIFVEVVMKNGSIYKPPNTNEMSFISDYSRLVCVLNR